RLYRQPVIRETPRPPVFRSNGFAFHAANYSGNRVESQDKCLWRNDLPPPQNEKTLDGAAPF
ncbi:MAG: hypothetical protein IJR99_00760, partial [Kiritimatiellae bacterium]|nr:hypothetical protein [Kiritimatiellia bacterium]